MTDTRRTRVFAYVIGIPAVAILHFLLFLGALGDAFVAGEGGGSVPFFPGAITIVLGFPFFYLLSIDSLVDSFKPILTDNQMIFVVTGLSGIFWGFVVVSIGLFIYSRK